MKNFKLFDIIFGWIAFAVAAVTYLLTIEPTASLWDCGEFISSAFKLEVGHPPGAPLFALVGRIFSLFAPSVDKVAMMLNSLSALASAFTILFLFWSITLLMRKYFDKKNNELTLSESIVTLGCGMIGALAYTFSDSFWFSAVEAEVYATSSLFTAAIFWAALKWEDAADTKYANRWLILIAYLTGLSIGVHLLNLLVIPAIAMLYYFKKYKPTTKGVIASIVTGGIILGIVLYIIVPWIPRIAFWFDLLFVNGFGLPINSGTLFFIVIFAAALSYLIHYTHKKGKTLANTVVLCITVISLGFSSYAMILIRASANTPMEQNNPDNIRALMSYLNREQYGDWPLFSGPYYNAPRINADIDNVYTKNNGKYEKLQEVVTYVYDKRFTTIFPRMHGTVEERHAQAYKEWGNVKGKPVSVNGRDGNKIEMVPTFSENLRFMFSYQLGWMYWRYFMWNFAGRQNDYQGYGNCIHGNWISGINFIDNARLGPQDELPDFLKNNKARNKYYMLPLLLGILGIVVHWARRKKDFSIVFMLFFLTGIAIVIYLNQTPYQPRERDYAYVGSFYAFAIWIGIGVAGLYELIKKISPKTIAASVSIILSLSVPYIMVSENWDDHDRSGRYVTADFGKNYLESCDKNGVVFTYGDNDTFSLWYNQEVEGNRTDVRVANTSYLYSDWYYEQLMYTYYDSQALKLSATPEKVVGTVRNQIPVIDNNSRQWELKQALSVAMSDDPSAKFMTNYSNSAINIFPANSNTVKITVDKDKVRKGGLVDSLLSDDMIYDQINVKLPQVLIKNHLAVLDIVANNFGERPIYLGQTAPQEFINLFRNNIKVTGLAYLITPEKLTRETSFDIEKNYDLFMNKYQYRGLNDPNIYWDESAKRIAVTLYRQGFLSLADALLDKGDKERVKAVLDKYDEVLPDIIHGSYGPNEHIPIYFRYQIGDTVKANEQLEAKFSKADEELTYYARLDMDKQIGISNEISDIIKSLRDFTQVANGFNRELGTKFADRLNLHKAAFPEIVKAYNIK
ncbi:MAG: DUF2723 domain-containing protein [Prevotellaceae bacterium]|jgi:hypothetical protein|nr:DUF2723 domain-containing protein [Prevotellaceae bacterium]